jgi:hypothetical protein
MKKQPTPELRKEAQAPVPQTNTGNLAEAVKSVYSRYGNDLSSFFRDAYEAEARKREKPEANNSHDLEVCPL